MTNDKRKRKKDKEGKRQKTNEKMLNGVKGEELIV